MKSIILCLVLVSAATTFEIANKDPCSNIQCRAGRECLSNNGVGQCVCMASCPDTYAPVCGTDGESYDSHCMLHRHACLTQTKIGISHKGFCKNKKINKKPLVKKIDPAVCYSSQRDALLLEIGKHWQETLDKQPWHVSGMTYRESLWGRYFTCDESKDKFLESDELLNCTMNVFFMARPGQDQPLTRALCIDAIVDAADSNKDWRLDFEEFTTMFSPGWTPPKKLCSLEGKNFHDGHEVDVDGHSCVCAVGSWVCTNPIHEEKNMKNKYFRDGDFYNDIEYNDEDDDVDDDYYYDDYNNEDDENNVDDGNLIEDEEDEEYLDKLFDELLDKLKKHKKERAHHNLL